MPLDCTACVSRESTPRVLVADDHAHVLMALSLLLRGEGFEADTAESVQEIRDRLHSAPYDLLLMDLNYDRDTTSGREGLDLLREVHERDPLLPVVVMTGWGSIDTAVEAMRRGARTFVQKPWENAALSDTLRREVAQGRAARDAHAHASRELDDARAIQRALLPAPQAALPGCDIAARWRPASDFGGDFYDVIRLDRQRVAISIGDVCGKGLPAALVMANVQAATRAFAAADPSPRTVAARINRELTTGADLGRFVTFFYAVYDGATGTLTYTNAGHNPPVLVRPDASVARLTAGGMVLGAFPNVEYEDLAVPVGAGDRIVLFTDGLIDPADLQDQEFGDERLVDLVVRRRDQPPSAIADAALDAVVAFAEGRLEDDATVLAVAIGESGEVRVERAGESAPPPENGPTGTSHPWTSDRSSRPGPPRQAAPGRSRSSDRRPGRR
jgi:sigma-B regulation protein RsbU (phosphoserine phosphatase)